jgi:hypothetical protein
MLAGRGLVVQLLKNMWSLRGNSRSFKVVSGCLREIRLRSTFWVGVLRQYELKPS